MEERHFYTKPELEEFRQIINGKLEEAKEESEGPRFPQNEDLEYPVHVFHRLHLQRKIFYIKYH